MRSTLLRKAGAAPEHADAATRRDSGDATGVVTPPFAGAERPGRYVLLGELGRGGMGVVHAAYDTTLDRKVALKLLRDTGVAESHLRMLREARVLARLSHPNVVAIYEVGEVGEQVFVAMELVEGLNLRAWLADRTRTQADILAVFLQAAEGLIAAHAAGLVHRDFKPDNVVIGVDGRVRVMDFGLARRSLEAPAPRDEEVITRPSDPQLTVTGAILGTPAYMAPEQHLGLPVTAAADIYSFAVALYEALHGARPYQGTSTRELADRVLRGKRTHTVQAGRVPAWLQAIVERGMALELVDRWPSMAAFAAALRRDPTRRRRLLAGLTVVGLAAATWFGAQHHRESTQIAACVAEGASIDATWNDAVAADLRASLPATSDAYARTTLDRVVPLLAEHAEQWRAARTDTCLDAFVQHTLDADTHDRMLACLDDDRVQLGALIEGLTRPGERDLDAFVPSALELPAIAECRDVDHLRRAPPLPEDRLALRAVRALVARVGVMRQMGNYKEALPVAHEAIAAAQQLAWPPLIAEAVFTHGIVLLEMGDRAGAEPLLERAYFQAVAAGAPLVAADVAEALGYLALGTSHYDDALRWAQHGDALLAALGVPETGLHRLDMLQIRGEVSFATGNYTAALTSYERKLAGELEHLGPGHSRLVDTYEVLGIAHNWLDHHREARSFAEQAVAVSTAVNGPDHPRTALPLMFLADYLVKLEGADEAVVLLLRAVAICERTYGPDGELTLAAKIKLAVAYMHVGRHDESIALFEPLLAINEKKYGPDAFEVGVVLHDYAVLLRRLARFSEALPRQLRALELYTKQFGPDHPEVGALLNNTAFLELDLGDDLHARPRFERALAILEAQPAPNVNRADSLRGLAILAMRGGHYTDAVALAERSVKVQAEGEDLPTSIADTHLTLAEALVGAGGSLARARTLAEKARTIYAATVGYTREVAAADALLARLP